MAATQFKLAQLNLGDSVTWTGTHTFSNAITIPGTQTIPANKLTIPSQATGDILYASSASAWARLAAGSNKQILTLAGGIPTWSTLATLTPISDASAANGVNYFSLNRMCNCIKIAGTVYEISNNSCTAAMNSNQADNSFDGDALSIASTASLQPGSGSMLIAGWFKMPASLGTLGPILACWDTGSVANSSYMLYYNNGPNLWTLVVSNGVSTFNTSTVTTMTVGQWYFIAGLWDQPSGFISMYTNAVADGTPTAATIHNGTALVTIANAFANPTWRVGGKLASIIKISVGISQAPALLTFLYGNGKGRNVAAIMNWLSLNSYPAPDALYGFENANNLGLDSSANANNMSKRYTTGPQSVSGPSISGS